MRKERQYTIKLTSKELWELMNNFDASFQEGEGNNNEVAEGVSAKLHEVWNKVPVK